MNCSSSPGSKRNDDLNGRVDCICDVGEMVRGTWKQQTATVKMSSRESSEGCVDFD